MSDELAARIVDARDQHRLLAIVVVILVAAFGFMPLVFVLLSATAKISALERPDNPPAYAQELTDGLWSDAVLGGGILLGTAAVCAWIWIAAQRRRRRAIAQAADLLAHGVRYGARVVQARRVSMTQLRIAVHVDGPVAPFSALIESRLDEAAFVNRPVVVACDRANPASFVLVPDW